MSEQLEQAVIDFKENELPVEPLPAPEANGAIESITELVEPANPHAEAGRKGAQRFHQLVQYGKLYEQEHNLKRGRQRLRQLVEEGRLYEQEHGLNPPRVRKRGVRVSKKQVIRRLLDSLMRIAKSSYRPHLARMVQALENEPEA
jgi:hypothetical protein